ncbi:hypothetical protein ACVNPX_02085 [Staphylococcus aureus]
MVRSASDYFEKLSNGSDIADATITWVSGQAPIKIIHVLVKI